MEGLSIWSMIPKSDPQRMDVQEDEPQESIVPEAAPSHRASAEISQPRRRRVKPEMEKKHLQYLLKQEFKLSKPDERIEIMTHKIELVDNKRPELPGVKSESDSDEEYYDAVPEYTVYTWGRGNDNVDVLPMDRLGLKQVECAVDHNIGLTDMGEVMTWGSFSGETANNERNSLENGIEKLYSGPTMMAAVKKGKLWLWGTMETSFGKLDYSKPGQILFYDHNDERYYIAGIKHMSIGSTHLAVLAANNMVYTMGSNLYKELVHKKSSGRFGVQMRPIYFRKDYLHNVKISAVGCGPNYTVMGYGNHFVIWGRFNGAKCKEEVFELEGYRNDAIQEFVCHANFLLVLTDNGNVFGFGDNTSRLMGIGDNAVYAELPIKLNFTHNDKTYKIISIRSGGEHFVAIDDTGRVWTWGRCEGGRLGYFPLQYSQDESSMSQDSGSGSMASVSCKSDKSAVKKKRRSSHRSSKKSDTFLENGFVAAVAPTNVQTVPKRVEQMEGQFVSHVSCTATGCMALGRDRVFGEYLHKLAAKTENWIPSFLEKLFSLLENRHVDQNILKVPGNVKLVNSTRDNIDKGLSYDINKMDTEDLIALLKLYLSELPNPLLSSTLTEEWNKIKRLPSPERRLEKYHKMLSKLPAAHKEVLLRLLKWCYLLSIENRARTKLFPKHVAKVFGPYLAHVKNPVLINNFIGIFEDMIEYTPDLTVKTPPPRPLPKPKSRSSSRSASPVRSSSPSDVSSSDSDSPNRYRPRSTSSPTKSSSSSSSSGKKVKPLPPPKPKNRPISPAKQLPKPPTKAAPSVQAKPSNVPRPTAGVNAQTDMMNTTNFDSKLNALQSQFDDLMKARQEYESMKQKQAANPAILQLYQHQAHQQSSLRKAVEKQREQAHKRIIIEEEEPSESESSEEQEQRGRPERPAKSPRTLAREDSKTIRDNVPKRPLPQGFKSRYTSDRLTASQRQELERMLQEEEEKKKEVPKIYFDKPPVRPQPVVRNNGRPASVQVSNDQIQQMIHGLQHGFKPQSAPRPAVQQANRRPAASNDAGIVMPPIPIRPKKPRTASPSQVHVPIAAPKKMVNTHVMQNAVPNNVNHIRPPVKQPQSRVPPAQNKPSDGRFVVQNNQQYVKFGGKLIPRAVPVQKKEELPPNYEKKPVDYDGLDKVIYPALTQLVQTHPNLRQETIPHLEHLQECFERLEEVKPGLALSFVARVFETLQEQ